MPVLEILTHPDPRLRQRALPVERFDDTLSRFVDDLVETMYAADGVGLAATQVGALVRVVAIDVGVKVEDAWAPDLKVLVNPEIVEADGELLWKEACLSVPGVRAEVRRCARVAVTYLDRHGASQRLEATGLMAVCVQHELDHLDGKLYVDHLEPLEQKLTLADYERVRADVLAISDGSPSA